MPVFQHERLEILAATILQAAGTPTDIAAYVAAALVESNLRGVDSHGVALIPWYLDEIAQGTIRPDGRPSTEKETPTMAVVRGNASFGIFALGHAMELAIQKAKASQVAAVGLIDCPHTGRLGRFVEAAANRDLFAMVIGGGGHRLWATVAPHGGAKPILGTNPFALGLPGGRFGPVVVDIATSAVSWSKLRVYRAKKQPVPIGWILDKDGRPSTNVEDFYHGGMQVPAGGHKGYGLALLAEVIGDSLLGEPREFSWLVITIDIGGFRPVADYLESCETCLQKVKDIPPAPGFDEVLLPGERGARTERERRENGIPVPKEIWQQIREVAQRVGVDTQSTLKQ